MSDGEINVDSIDGEVSTSANIVGQLYPQGEKGDTGEPGQDGFSPIVETSKVGKETTITITDAEGTHTATILDGADGQGSGDMRTEVYDTDQNGIVDNAEKVNNHTVNSDVPADAVFTDTTYTAGTGIDITGNVITNTQTSAEWGNITGTLSDQTDLKNALDSKANTSAVPTKVSDLNNDSGFIDKDVNNLTNYDTSTTVDTKISNSEEVLIGSDSGIKASHELWVDTSDVTPYVNSEISNDYGTAQNLGYSQEYVNDRFDGTKTTGDMVVNSIRTKNIFDEQIEPGTYSQTTGAKTTDPTFWRSTNLIKVKPSTTYKVSINSEENTYNIRWFYYQNDGTFISTDTHYITVTTPSNCYYITWHSSGLKTAYPNGITNMMIEEGDQTTTYSPYQELTFNNKNAGDMVASSIRTKNMIDVDALAWGTLSQTDGRTPSASSTVVYTPYYIPVQPGEVYTISYKGSTQITIRLFKYDGSKAYTGTETQGGSGVSYKTFTVGSGTYYLRIQLSSDFTNQLQLEQNSKQTSYSKYQSLSSPYSWKLAGTQAGTTAVPMPIGASEYCVMVTVDGNPNVKIPITIPMLELTPSGRGFNAGYTQSSINVSAGARITASITSVNLASAYLNGVDKTSTTAISVYYR